MNLSDYLAYLEAEGRSPNTILAYGSDLRALEPTPAGVRNFKARLDAIDYAPATAARKIAAARGYCSWLEELGVDVGNWAAVLTTAGWGSNTFTPPPPPAVDDLERLLAAPAGGTPLGLRNRAILRMLVESGGRASEVVGLDAGDVNLGSASVRLVGRREREVPLSPEAVEALRDYVYDGWPKLAHRLGGALFVNKHGRRLTRQGLWLIVRQLCQRAGIEEISPSRLRHAAAARLVDEATDLPDAQYLMGHVALHTTLAYVAAARRRVA